MPWKKANYINKSNRHIAWMHPEGKKHKDGIQPRKIIEILEGHDLSSAPELQQTLAVAHDCMNSLPKPASSSAPSPPAAPPPPATAPMYFFFDASTSADTQGPIAEAEAITKAEADASIMFAKTVDSKGWQDDTNEIRAKCCTNTVDAANDDEDANEDGGSLKDQILAAQ